MKPGLQVQRRMCPTCIFRPDSTLDLKALLAQVADPKLKGHFRGARICHYSRTAVCRGFWQRFKDRFDAGQLAQRLDCVVFVDHDIYRAKRK